MDEVDEILDFRNFLDRYLEANKNIDDIDDIDTFKAATAPLLYELFDHIDTLQKFNLNLQKRLDEKNIVYLEARYKALRNLSLELANNLIELYEKNIKFSKDLIFDLKDLRENKILKKFPRGDVSEINNFIFEIGIKVKEDTENKETSLGYLEKLKENLEESKLDEKISKYIDEEYISKIKKDLA